MNYKIIDTHAHIYPQKIAAKAVAAVGKFYELEMNCKEGTAEHLLEIAKPFGVEKIIVHSVATVPHQVESINNFIKNESDEHSEFVPFATLHPDMSVQEIKDEFARIKEFGLDGIKLHPDCQGFRIDGRRNRKILDAMDASLPVLYHTGDRRKGFSNPKQMIAIAKEYPQYTFIAAHFGGYSEWEYSEEYKDVENVYFDTSSSLAFLTPSRASELIRFLGADRFMFGTDYPMWNYKDEIARITKLDLTESERENIFYYNAKRILKI